MSLCYDAWTIESVLYLNFILDIQTKGPFKYYVIKEMVGWGGQMMMFDDKVGGWGWLNADVSKNIQGKKLCLHLQEKRLEFSLKNLLEIYLSF
jgi:hypothetical protein